MKVTTGTRHEGMGGIGKCAGLAPLVLFLGGAFALGACSAKGGSGSPDMTSDSATAPMPDGQSCTPGCNGAMLTTCDSQGKPATTDCSQRKDVTGKAMTCDFLADEKGHQAYDCIGDYNGGCGTETQNGRCDGTKVIRCLSADSGNATLGGEAPVNVQTFDCAMDPAGNTACVVGPDGVAGCSMPGSMGCGAVTAEGACAGATLTHCVKSAVETIDCKAAGKDCGLVDKKSYGCVNPKLYKPAMGGDMALAVTGTFVYQKKTVDTTDFNSAMKGFAPDPVLTPVRLAMVQLVKMDGTEIQRTFTDEMGSFTLYLPDNMTMASVIVATAADPTTYPVTVRNCPPANDGSYPQDCNDKVGSIYGFQSMAFMGPTALGSMTITEANDNAGAFNVFNLMLKGAEFARVNLNRGAFPAIPALTVQWRKSYRTQTSYFSAGEGIIVVQGMDADTDEFDDPVLMHEFGHFIENAFSVSDSPGGSHNGSPTDPRLGWGEGYGTYAGCRIAGSAIYFDTSGSGISVSDLNNTGLKADPMDQNGIAQLMSEMVVGEILWRIDLGSGGNSVGAGAHDGQGSAPVFDVLGGYFKGNAKYQNNRGVVGRDLVDFLDGWFCRDRMAMAAASTPIIQQVVTTDHGFPYDDYAHMASPIGSCP